MDSLLCLKTLMVDPESLAPSTREAWFSSSLRIRQPCRTRDVGFIYIKDDLICLFPPTQWTVLHNTGRLKSQLTRQSLVKRWSTISCVFVVIGPYITVLKILLDCVSVSVLFEHSEHVGDKRMHFPSCVMQPDFKIYKTLVVW